MSSAVLDTVSNDEPMTRTAQPRTSPAATSAARPPATTLQPTVARGVVNPEATPPARPPAATGARQAIRPTCLIFRVFAMLFFPTVPAWPRAPREVSRLIGRFCREVQ